jgi:5'-3' exonuclease
MTTFQHIASYPFPLGGLQLSASMDVSNEYSPIYDENDSATDDNVYDDVPPSQQQQRPHPPTLSDESSYGESYGAYQYRSEDGMDEPVAPQQSIRPPYVPIQSQNSIRNSRHPIRSSNEYSDPSYDKNRDATRTSRTAMSTTVSNTKATLRPPVHVSIPSLSTSTLQQASASMIDVDLSVYDTYFESNDTAIPMAPTTPEIETTQPNVGNPTVVTTYDNRSRRSEQASSSAASSRPDGSTSLIPSTHFHAGQTLTSLPGYDPDLDRFLAKAAYGVGTTTSIDVLQNELASIEQTIYEQNQNTPFNINSPKQVAIALYGKTDAGAGYSTNKDVLEGMAGGGNRLAASILQYRSVKYKIAKFVRQEDSRKKGTAVRSALTVARPKTLQSQENSTQFQVQNDAVVNVIEQPISELRDVMADPLLLLDASAYIFRAYYSMPPIHRPDGMPTGAVMGFCKMLNSLLLNRMLEGEQPRLVLCFDAKGKTFRHDIYDKYKANRPAAPMDLVPQFDLVRQAAKAYGICQIEAIRFEADDVIATLACKAIEEGVDANIMSGDKDLMQLVTELNVSPSIQIIDPMKKERTTYQQVIEKWQVPPKKLGDLLALAGDTADNVPGVRGIGPKTAAKLINDFGSLENLLNNIHDVKQQGVRDKLYEDKVNARLSRVLVELNCTVPMNELLGLPDGAKQKISELRMEAIDPDRIIAFYDQMGFKELKRSFENSLKGIKVKRKKGSTYNKRTKATIPTPEDYKDVPF